MPQASAPARPGTRHAHLLASAYRRINALCPALDVAIVAAGRPPRPGWVDGDALLAKSDLVEAFLDAIAANTTKRYGQKARPDVVATKALHGYLWSICLLMSGPWYLQRRVPLLRPADLRVELATGRLAVAPGAFACLPEDPASAFPGVRVLPHEAALRAELLRAVADHARVLLGTFGPRLRRGPRALWGMVGDDLVSGIWHLGRALGQEEQAVLQATELLPGPVPPFPGGADFRRVTDPEGISRPARTRLGCCLHYTIQPAEVCGTCPRVCGSAARPALDAGRPDPLDESCRSAWPPQTAP